MAVGEVFILYNLSNRKETQCHLMPHCLIALHELVNMAGRLPWFPGSLVPRFQGS
jgi:hypothetical protein